MNARHSNTSQWVAMPTLTSRPPAYFDVAALTEDSVAGWTLRGPGIQDSTQIEVDGLPYSTASTFRVQWGANHAGFPCGIDLILATPQQIVGMPRTTRIEQEA